MLSGNVTRKLTVIGIRVSKGAKEAIENAGGKVVETPIAQKAARPAKKKAEKVEVDVDKASSEAESLEESKPQAAPDEA
jgi:hypothetical protein